MEVVLQPLYCTVQYSTVQLYCTVRYSCMTAPDPLLSQVCQLQAVREQNCTLLQCTAVSCIKLHCNVLHCTALYCTALYCTALHCTALHCTALHCTALHCTALHCTALHCTVGRVGVRMLVHVSLNISSSQRRYLRLSHLNLSVKGQVNTSSW